MHPLDQSSTSGTRAQIPWTPPALNPTNPALQTFLPSIRQLHPELPPSALSHQLITHGHRSSHIIPTPLQFVHRPASTHRSSLGARKASETWDSSGEADGIEPTVSPPKKKRRRQALSCTECKRRKIKCDRAQPCAQCSRRGEQLRCQWHIAEPIEKYVTRGEYNELRARLNDLSDQVQRLQRLGSIPKADGQPDIPGKPIDSVAVGPAAYSASTPHERSHRPAISTQRVVRHTRLPPYQSMPPTPTGTLALMRSSPPAQSSPLIAKQSPLSLASIISSPSNATPTKRSRVHTLIAADYPRPRSRQSQVLAGQVAH